MASQYKNIKIYKSCLDYFEFETIDLFQVTDGHCIKKTMEIIDKRLYFALDSEVLASPGKFPRKMLKLDDHYALKTGNKLMPPSIKSILRHCAEVHRRLREYPALVYITNDRSDHHSIMKRTHSALFMGAYSVLYLHWSTEYIRQKIKQHIGENLSNFCDHKGSYEYELSIYDCLEGIKVGVVKHGWFTLDGVNSLKHGLNMNWVVPNKLIAMKDPKLINSQGQTCLNPKYVKELLKNKIDYVVRLNGKDCEQDSKYGKPYPLATFFAEGIVVCDIPIKDGGTPTQKQLEMFLEICSIPESQMAVHCHAGMGRTGTMIACCLIRDYDFTARQAVAWLNLCRRGSVMGKQHDFLDEYFKVISRKKSEDTAENITCADDELKKVNSVMQEEKTNRNTEEEMEPKIKKGRLDQSTEASEKE